MDDGRLDWAGSLARYNRWMNDRLYDVAGRLTDDDRRRDLGAFFRSVHGTLEHLLMADRLWLGRFARGGPGAAALAGAAILENSDLALDPGSSPAPELWPDFGVLRRERAATDESILGWAAQLSSRDLDAFFAYRTVRGDRRRHPGGQAVLHFFNHQTHHRGQVTDLLMRLGRDPGVTDLLVMPGFITPRQTPEVG
jgi:uncharacterized damage-inducible protein DinB